VQNAAGDDGESWADQFRSVYSPEKWLGVHRAACAFLGGKIRERSAVPSPVMAGLREALEAAEEALPKMGERESVFCSIQGHHLRTLVAALASVPSPEPEGEG
jgi:hypothetical protein